MFTPQGKTFAFYSFILPSRCLNPCEIQSDTCFSLFCFWCLLGFFCLVGCLVGLLLLRQINPCTKAIIFYNIGKVIWHSFFSSNGLRGLHFARPFSLCTVLLVYGSGFAGCLFISQLQIPTDSQLLSFLLLQTVPSAALQEIRLSSSPDAVNMSSCAVGSFIGGKITPAYFIPRFLCLSPLAFLKDNTTFVVTSLVSKQMPLWDQLLLYTSKTCVWISDIYARSVNNSSSLSASSCAGSSMGASFQA